jgi:hypothetical protein
VARVSAPSINQVRTAALDHAIEGARTLLLQEEVLRARIRVYYAAVAASRDLATPDIVAAEFLALARTKGLRADLGRHADEDLQHVTS